MKLITQTYIPLLLLSFGFVGCRSLEMLPDGVSRVKAEIPTEEYKHQSDVFEAIWKKAFIVDLAALPTKGGVAANRIPYSGSDYPWRYVLTENALRKYDLEFGTHAAEWELKYHYVSDVRTDRDKNPNWWWGHCNGWVSAAIRHREPSQNARGKKVIFTPQDVKALLAEIYTSNDVVWLAGRRSHVDTDPVGISSRKDGTVLNETEDVNAGAFHLVVANWIGKAKYPIGFDIEADSVVENRPLHDFDASLKPISKKEALRLLEQASAEFVANPKAVDFVQVSNTITFAEKSRRETIGQSVSGRLDFIYILELDDLGRVVGGEWISQSLKTHPDFLWVPSKPVTPEEGRRATNPNVNFEKVLALWSASIPKDSSENFENFEIPAGMNRE